MVTEIQIFPVWQLALVLKKQANISSSTDFFYLVYQITLLKSEQLFEMTILYEAFLDTTANSMKLNPTISQ